MKLWDATGSGFRERLRIRCGEADRVEGCTALAFMADGHTLAVAGNKGEVRRYETNLDSLFSQAVAMVDPKQINPDDCRKYLQTASCEPPRGFTHAK